MASLPWLIVVVPALAAFVLALRPLRNEAAIARLTIVASAIATALAVSWAGTSNERLSATLAIAIGSIALIVGGFAARSMSQGSIAYRRFFMLLNGATAGALAVAIAPDLRVLAAAWIVTGWCASGLLAVSGRPAARFWARRHAMVEAIGDGAWFVALVIAWRDFHTFDLATLGQLAQRNDGALPLAFALLVAGATRSALGPFNHWLPNSMEAPTAVSAFMHAGIVNGAGMLFAKTAWVLSAVPSALAVAALAGGITAATGATVMLVRPEVKRKLGWSTVGQMGFMVLQCGCGAFAGAVVHLILHGGYKSAAFLGAAGSIDDLKHARRAPVVPASTLPPFVRAALALVPSTIAIALVVLVFRNQLATLPAAAATLALGWAGGTVGAGRSLRLAVDPFARLVLLAGCGAVVAAYCAAVVIADGWLGAALPRSGFFPATIAVAIIAVAAAIVDALGFALRPPDALYTLALVEGSGAPMEARA